MESTSQNNGINVIKETRKLFNEVRGNLSREETNRIRKKLYKNEDDYDFLKKNKQEGSLTNIQKNELRNVKRYLKNIGMHLKNCKKYLKKLERYQYGLDHLFNEEKEEEDYITLNNSINARKLFNEVETNLSCEEINEIRKKLHRKEAVYNFLKKKQQIGSLTNRENRVLNNIDRYLKNLKKDLEKLQKYSITYGLDYLFNELDEGDYYKPREVKSPFDGSYMLYESSGDKDSKLLIYEYFDIIRPYSKDMVDNHKARGEWKIQLTMQVILFLL